MTGFTLEFTFKDDAFIQIEGQNVKYWASTGLPEYEGSLDGFANLFPIHINELVKFKALKKSKNE